MSSYIELLSVLILLSAFLLISCKKITSYIKMFRLQSLLIAIGALGVGIENFIAHGHIDIIVVTIIMIVLKIFYIPNTLNKLYENVEHIVEKDFFGNIPILVMSCIGLVMVVYYGLKEVLGGESGVVYLEMVELVSVVLIGIVFMISRKKAIGQIIGFLVVENGIFAVALFQTGGVPLIVDLGIFIDLLTGVLIMGLMVFKINKQFESTNINKMRNLRG